MFKKNAILFFALSIIYSNILMCMDTAIPQPRQVKHNLIPDYLQNGLCTFLDSYAIPRPDTIVITWLETMVDYGQSREAKYWLGRALFWNFYDTKEEAEGFHYMKDSGFLVYSWPSKTCPGKSFESFEAFKIFCIANLMPNDLYKIYNGFLFSTNGIVYCPDELTRP